MFKTILIIFFITSSLIANKINIAVAANVSYAIDDLVKEFNKTNPNTKVQVTLGSSGKLTAQIKNGAPYDVFLSANMLYPNDLYKNGLAITKPIIYAKGSLAVLSSKEYDFSKSLEFLNNKDITRIAIANPKTAPYGKATVEALKKARLYEKVKKKFVYGDSISQTVMYALKAADLGFVAKSTLFSSKMRNFKEGINWIEVDSKLYTPINQGIVILKNAKDKKEAQAFYEFIKSSQAKAIFKEYGYLIP